MTVLELYNELKKLIDKGFENKEVLVDGYLNICSEVSVDNDGDIIIQ